MGKRHLLAILLLLTTVGILSAQTRRVTGHVSSSEDGEPVIGAAVLVKGFTSIGAQTDINGDFILERVPEEAKTLIVSYMGMITKEVPIQANLRIILDSDTKLLDEVVVTGMVQTDKRLFTGASTKLSASDAKISGLSDVSRGLEGKAAGVTVQNVSGTFGTAPKIRVRGATSIYGSSKPLWVVDGVVMEDAVEVSAEALSSGDATTLISSAIAGLNAEDIESFQILKDGSATSIYGARAMAGVIVITTKKGTAGQSSISYSSEYTYRAIPSYRNFNIMNSQDQMGIYKEMEQKGWLNMAGVSNRSSSGIYGKMYDLINNGTIINDDKHRNAYLREAEYRNTDWFETLFNSNVMQNHSVSISSGTDKASYYSSLSAMLDPGWTKQSGVKRYTANLNATYKILPNLTINLISNGSFREQRAPGTLSRSTNAVSGEVSRDFDINPYSYALNTSRALDPSVYYKRNYSEFNIIHELENNYIDINVLDLRFQGQLAWTIMRGLTFKTLGAVKYQSSTQEHHITDYSNQANAYREMPTTTIRDANPFLYKNPDDPYAEPITVLPQGGIYKRTDNRMLAYDFRADLTYNTVLDDKHILGLYLGSEVNSSDRHSTWFRGWGMQYEMGEIPFYAWEVFKKGKEENAQYYGLGNGRSRTAAFFGNATYSYEGRYTLNGTYRYEGSNALGRSTKARWLPTWNISAAWNAHEEKFFDVLKPTLSHLMLKGSYSLTAERGPRWVTNSRVVIGSQTHWKPTSADSETSLALWNNENSQLTYEKKHEMNFGADMGFLKNRINVSFDWYKRNNFDLIGVTTTAGVGGEVRKYGNVANMASSGVELSVSSSPIKTKDFSWETSFIFSHNKNKITRLDNFSRVIDLITGDGFALEGYPNRSLFSIPFKGLTNEGIPYFLDDKNQLTTTGIYFQERENVGFLEYSGTSEPTMSGSFGNIFNYKNFKLNVFLTYSMGNVVRLDPVFRSSYSDLSSLPREYVNRWVVPGDEHLTNVPAIAARRQGHNDSKLGLAYNAYNYSTERIASGDFVRLKEISLSYDFPKKMVSTWKLSTLSLKLQATNLALLYADKKLNGQDPEFVNTGGVAAPVPKQFTLTLRVGL